MTDKLKELVAQWPHEYYDRKGRRHDALIPETGWVHADELCRRCLVETLLVEQAPAGEFDAWYEKNIGIMAGYTHKAAMRAAWNAAGRSSQPAETRDPAAK